MKPWNRFHVREYDAAELGEILRTVFPTVSVEGLFAVPEQALSQPIPLPNESKVKNYLPHMTWPEVEALAKRTDMVIIPVGALEQHVSHT